MRAAGLLRGALVTLGPRGQVRSTIPFQFTPDTMTRTVKARASAPTGERGAPQRLSGPPQETIRLDVELDDGDGGARRVASTLAALECLLAPSADEALRNERRQQQGELEIIPPEAPPVVLVWGSARVLQVRLDGLTIREEAYDAGLVPVRAKVTLDLRVLSYSDLGMATVGGGLYLAGQFAKQRAAAALPGASIGWTPERSG